LKDFSRMAFLSRRHVLGLGGSALAAGVVNASWLRQAVSAEMGTEAHGLSVFGDLKYPADFQHFDYINPAAPKGGMFSLIPSVRAYNQSYQTFNSFNAYILKGEGAQGMDMTFAALMGRAGDEPDAIGADFAGQADLSLHVAPRGAIPRWLQADGAGRGVLADDAEDQRASADPSANARHGQSGS
jgi:hypothetical protein